MSTKERVVLIADIADFEGPIDLESNHLEMTDEDQLEKISNAIREMGKDLTVYHDPVIFSENIKSHQNDFVVTLWSGENSRNRRAIIPAICEGNRIKYMGNDPYTALICQDKSLSKSFIQRFNLDVPKHIIYDSNYSIKDLTGINYPVVIKPSLEGGSIGISSCNLVGTPKEAIVFAHKLSDTFNQPIMIEEFVYGSEISICLAGNNGNFDLVEAIEVSYSDQPDYLFDKLYSYEEKRQAHRIKHRQQKNVTDIIPANILNNAKDLYIALGKVDLFRIDGRLHDDKFAIIELTPDVGMSPSGIFASAYDSIGMTYNEMIASLINSSERGYL